MLALLTFAAAAAARAQTCTSIAPDAKDGVVASPSNHKVLLETEDIRVLEVSSAPHTADQWHTHARPAVMITDGFSTGSYTAMGEAPKMHVPPADTTTPRVVFIQPEGPHKTENLGETPFHAIRIELKHPGCGLPGDAVIRLDSTDALTAAPLSHRVLLENDDVRVLDVNVGPHRKEPMHTHAWTSVMYVYQVSSIIYSTPNHPGTPMVLPANLKPAPQLLEPEGLHSVENVGDTPFRAIRVEFKHANPDSAKP